MAEMETLAEGLAHHLFDAWMRDESQALPDWQKTADAALSWLGSVLADDATVEVVARTSWDAYRSRWGDMGEPDDLFHTVARAALAALSAHLVVPGGVAARKQEAKS